MSHEHDRSGKHDEDVIVQWVKDIGQVPVSDAAAVRATVKARDLVAAERGPTNRVSQLAPVRFGWFIMRNRLSFLATAATVLIIVLWLSSALSPKVVIAQTAKAIRDAKSYTLSEVQFIGERPGEDPANTSYRRIYWRSEGERRIERLDDEGDTIKTTVLLTDKPGIEIDHEHKVYFAKSRDKGPITDALVIEKLGQYDLTADRDLGKRMFGNKATRGFELDVNKIDPDFAKGELHLEVWVDQQTNLPIEIVYAMAGQSGRPPAKIRMYDIRWNIELPDNLFRTDPPKGYSKRVRSVPSEEEQLAKICEALRIYADLLDGHYPRVSKIYPDKACQEIGERYGFDPFGSKTDEVIRSEEYALTNKANIGFGWLFLHFKSNADIKYNGKRVGPKDADKVLVRWKLDDGQYQVIFGDLRSQIMTQEAIRKLESKDAKTSRVDHPTSTVLTQSKRPFNHHPRTFGYTFDSAPTCHWRIQSFKTSTSKDWVEGGSQDTDISAVEEGWFVPNAGIRVEVRENDDKLTRLMVQNSRWRYVWNMLEKTVTATHPGSDLPPLLSSLIQIQTRRAVIKRQQKLRASYVSETDELDGEETEKITFRLLADKATDNFSPIHFVPADFHRQIQSPDTQFRNRIYWFDSKTSLVRGRRCGCKSPKYVYEIDYPTHIPPEHFTFLVPADAKLVVRDDELGRVLVSYSASFDVRKD